MACCLGEGGEKGGVGGKKKSLQVTEIEMFELDFGR